MQKFMIVIIVLSLIISPAISEEVKYILHDKCINILYRPAVMYFIDTEIQVIRDPRGIILRFGLIDPEDNFYKLTNQIENRLKKIEYFLAKIKNPAIIEVHTAKNIYTNTDGLKSWEISAVIAGNIEKAICKKGNVLNTRIHSVGYGEFLPENNPPNNGGKLSNRVDIIIMCNISGE